MHDQSQPLRPTRHNRPAGHRHMPDERVANAAVILGRIGKRGSGRIDNCIPWTPSPIPCRVCELRAQREKIAIYMKRGGNQIGMNACSAIEGVSTGSSCPRASCNNGKRSLGCSHRYMREGEREGGALATTGPAKQVRKYAFRARATPSPSPQHRAVVSTSLPTRLIAAANCAKVTLGEDAPRRPSRICKGEQLARSKNHHEESSNELEARFIRARFGKPPTRSDTERRHRSRALLIPWPLHLSAGRSLESRSSGFPS